MTNCTKKIKKNFLFFVIYFGLIPIAKAQNGCWKEVAVSDVHTLAINTDGTLWAWGYNRYGQLGNGTKMDSKTPIQIGTDNNWLAVSNGQYSSLALKNDGTLWAWGYNGNGQMGDGTNVDKSVPTRIGTDNNWAKISSGGAHSVAIKTDGTLWTWGGNWYGQMGDGSTTQKNTPTRIGTDNNWSKICASYQHTLAIKTNGTLWAWGHNENGILGDGTTTQKTTPVQVGTANNWSLVSSSRYHTMAIKTNGSLWGWGSNFYYQLGNGTTTSSVLPIQIGSALDWSIVSAGNLSTLAIKTNGTLWGWGYNYGRLGDGTDINKNNPTQIGTATNWINTKGGNEPYMYALNSNNVLYLSGQNQFGNLGNGTTITRNFLDDVEAFWYLDNDQDGYYVGTPIVACSKPGLNYYSTSNKGLDCNDANATINAGASEILGNGIDENCNGKIDEPNYCFPINNFNSTYYPITNVTIGSINNSTGAEPNNYYGNYKVLSTNATVGEVQNISVNPFQNNAVYIDFNDDGDFTDAGENVIPSTYFYNATFTIPSNAPLGSHTLRVINRSQTYQGPCETDGGEAEDYTIILLPNCKTYSTTNVNLCSTSLPYNWNGINRNSSGIFTFTTTNSIGCDSIATLNLNVTQAQTWYFDADGDNYYVGTPITSCSNPGANYSSVASLGIDCNDNNANIYPGATEVLGNGIDENCNGRIDELTYCMPYNLYDYNYSPITNVTLGSINNNTNDEPNYFGNYTHLTTNATLGELQNITVSSDYGYSIYIDFNDDGDFIDAGEAILQHDYNYSRSFTITSNAPLGLHTLRVISASFSQNPCQTDYGEAEDYSINIIPNCKTTSTNNVSICSNQLPYSWNGINRNSSGTYTFVTTNSKGCDSTATLNLTVNSSPSIPIITTSGNTNICTGGMVNLSVAVPQTPVIPSSLIAYWNFNEGSGNTVSDQSANNLTGTFVGSNAWATSNAFSGSGNAVSLSTSRYISVPDNSIFNSMINNFTIESWIYLDGVKTDNTIIDRGNYNFLFQAQAYGGGLGFYNTSGGWSFSNVPLPNNTWIHVACTWNASTGILSFYKNGVLINTYNRPAMNFGSGPLNIGRQDPNGCQCNYFPGKLDELRVWNVTRTASEIAANYSTEFSANNSSGTYSWSPVNGLNTSNGNAVIASPINSTAYSVTLTNSNGCSSTSTPINVNINSNSSTSNVTAASSYTWNGVVYSQSGTYSKVFTNSKGCDSTAILYLTITSCTQTTSTTNITACNSYFWNGMNYTTSGTYSKVLVNSVGCDSVASLTLKINSTTSSTTVITVSNSINWNGDTYTQSGTYTKVLTNSKGCDSIAHLVLSVLKISGPSSVCLNGTISLNANIIGGFWINRGRYTMVDNGNGNVSITAINAGTTLIEYSLNGVVASFPLIINSLPSVPNIAYASGGTNPQAGAPAGSFCRNRIFNLAGFPSGGTWSSSGTISVNALGNANTGNTTGFGSVTYTFTNSNGCRNSRTMSGNVVACASRGTEVEMQKANFILFPNPAKNVLNIRVDNLVGKGEIVLTDLLGKKIKHQLLSLGNNVINVSQLAKGMYLINIISEQTNEVKKIIVE